MSKMKDILEHIENLEDKKISLSKAFISLRWKDFNDSYGYDQHCRQIDDQVKKAYSLIEKLSTNYEEQKQQTDSCEHEQWEREQENE